MRIIDLKNGEEIKKISVPLCLALGNFDGVHEGHKTLINAAIAKSKEMGIGCGVWTFETHPMTRLSEKGIFCLTDNEEKNEIFEDLGADYAIYEDFDLVKDFSPEDYIQKVLIEKYDCRCAVCGFNFKFGKSGRGNSFFLENGMKNFGREAFVLPPVYKDERVISSTEIRFFIENGDMESAFEMMGRPYSIKLPVEHGQELGRTIGIPTINQRFSKNKIRPSNGIYAVKCYIGGEEYLGVANVGSRPTVNSDETDINCETHIIGYDGWLYENVVRVDFYKKLRDEMKFSGVEELKKTVENDIKATCDYFKK